MSNQETQVVIMRKRKRQDAVDPCLGFYCDISSLAASQPSTSIIANLNADKDATDHPGWTPLPQDSPSENELDHGNDAPQPSDLSSEPEPLTVEAFLRRDALGRGRIRVRKYGRKYRNRCIIQSDDEYVEEDRSQGHDKSSGQLDDSRPALRLLPIRRLNNDSTKPKPRAIRLWNTVNARGVPFRTSSFSEPTKIKKDSFARGSIGAQRHPLSTWSTFRRSTHRNKAGHESLKVPPDRNHPTRCAPLVFVPLADAEEAYNKMFHPTSMAKREALDHGHEPQCSAIAPLILVPADYTENVSPNQSYAPGPSFPTAPSAKIPVPDSVLEPAPEVSESLPPTAIALTQASPSCSKKVSSDKCLKPLGSFLEQFIERVRAATQAEDTIASRSQYQSQVSTLGSAESQESLAISEFVSDHGLEQTLSMTHESEQTPGSSCSDGSGRRNGQPLTCSNGEPDYLHAATMRVDQFERASLDGSVDICYAPQELAPFDINAALLAYTRAGNSSIQLCSFESLS